MDLGLKGRVAIVAASSQGIGRATAEGFAAEGCRVAMCARNPKTLEQAADEMRGQYNTEVFVEALDVTDADAVHRFVAAVAAKFGKVDICVTNAGGPPAKGFLAASVEDWRKAVDLNFLSTVFFAREIIPHMQRQHWGRIITLTSISTKQPVADLVLSNAVRAAVVGLVKSLANEFGKDGILVNNVGPGYTATDRLKELAQTWSSNSGKPEKEIFDAWAADAPVKRLGEPREVADTIVWLASERASYVTGQTILAQGGATGAITGTVQDPSGAVVAGAEVRIVNQDTGVLTRTTKTDGNGSFTATLLPVGTYTLSVTSPGFQEAKFTDIAVRITETTRMEAKLRPVAVQEKIEVQAQVQTVETSTATTGQAIESRTIRDLPLATQNFHQLLSLSTGAQSELNASAQLGRGNVRIIVNGQREDNNNYLIEGISATDYNVAQATNVPLPNPDVVGEFKVQTSLYDASQGRNGGGNVNAILKSGTKTFHGDAYEFFRNDKLNANEYFLNRAGQPRPTVKQNIFGGSLGGPVGPDAKLGFFFLNYQGTRQRSGLSPGTAISNPGIPSLPTDRSAASLAAAFSTADFPIAPNQIDPVVLALLNFKGDQFGASPGGFLIPSVGIPDLNPAKAAYTKAPFVISKPGRYTDDQFTANWDREFRGGNDKLGARFFFSDAESLLPFGAGGLQASLGGTLASSISSTDWNFPYELPVRARFLTLTETH